MIERDFSSELRDAGKNAVDGISSALGAIFVLLAVGTMLSRQIEDTATM